MPERVEAAGHVARLEDDHLVPEPPQLVGTAQPGRARADDGHALAGRRAGLEEADAPVRGGVAGEALEPADLDRAPSSAIRSTQAPSQRTSVGQAGRSSRRRRWPRGSSGPRRARRDGGSGG